MFTLQMFDAYENRVPKGSKVTLSLEKIVIQDHGGMIRKVLLLQQTCII